VPEDLYYLIDWAYSLCGRSGASMAGVAPLSYSQVADWARLMHIAPTRLELQALMALDAVIRNPERTDEEEDEPVRIDTPWPESKHG
jgi:hypothetical protein